MIRIAAVPETANHHLFETSFGWCGIGWTQRGIARFRLPEDSAARVARRFDDTSLAVGEPDEATADVVRRIRRYFDGAAETFAEVALDRRGIEPFALAIYAALGETGYGATTSYGELARKAGHAGLTRETGQALGDNPLPLLIPCHRVLAAKGAMGGFSAPGGVSTKRRMLELEGVDLSPRPGQLAFGF